MQEAHELKMAQTELMQIRVALKEVENAIAVAKRDSVRFDWLQEQQAKGRALESYLVLHIAQLKEKTKKTE
jgi:hypothetical protein